jgi:tetratricopeptide (TPR) repeat protein
MSLRLIVALFPFWFWQSQFIEARRWMEQALHTRQDPSPLHAATLYSAAMITHHVGDYAIAEHLATEGIATARACADPATEGRSLIPLSLVAGRRGDHQAAAAHAAAALAIFRQLDDEHHIAHALTRLGVATHGGGDPAAAKSLHEEALRLWRERGWATGVAMALGNLGDVARDQGDLKLAAERERESLQISWALRVDWLVVEALFFIADVARLAGCLSDAARVYGAAERVRESIGHALFGNLATTAERSIAATRSALGAEPFSAAWERGYALRGEQAVADALGVAAALAGNPR